MAAYRLYCLDGTGRISLADWIEATTDDEAIKEARHIKHGAVKCEIWQKDRLIAQIEGERIIRPRQLH
jgi:hypothetical protein